LSTRKLELRLEGIRESYLPRIRETKLTLYILRRSPLAMTGITIIAAFVFMAIFAPLISPTDPNMISLDRRLEAPGSSSLFGRDLLGRDILSRVIYGSRISLLVGFSIVGVGFAVGATLGLIAGYLGGKIGNVIMRVADVFMAFPPVVLAILFVTTLGPGLFNGMIALASIWWPRYTRLTYGQALSVRENDYVAAARLTGESSYQIILRHIFPNSTAPLIVQSTIDLGDAILTAAFLSFLGMGAQPPTAEWGSMVALGRLYIFSHWWMSLYPGLAIAILVVGINFLGDGLRDALDPVIRRVISVKRETSCKGGVESPEKNTPHASLLFYGLT
jgi:peptide/nickel transport system permease protein